jgi:ubiquinone/menaquinone biosynthesis C-methylase UbiE
MIKMNEKKPKYGWYVKGLIIGLIIIGIIGFTLIIFGLFFEGWLSFAMILFGILIILLFFWPGVGMAIMNINLSKSNFSGIELDAIDVIESPIILDVGCGTGRTAIKIAKTLKKGGKLIGIDIYSKVAIGGNALETVQKNAKLEGVAEKTTFQYGSAVEIQFEKDKFDIINFFSVLHELHMEGELDKALNEAYRVLKPGGYLYVGEWNRSSWQLIAYCGIFCLVFKPQIFWTQILKKHGFDIKKKENRRGFYLFSAKKPLN